MRKLLLITLNFLVISGLAQDLLMKRNGQEINCKVLEITPEVIKYAKDTISLLPVYSIYINDVLLIKFKDGSKETFDNNQKYDPMSVSHLMVETSSKFIDPRDGQDYKTVLIGDQWWMAENLKFKTSSSKCFKVDSQICEKCGQYYYYSDAIKSCPEGWHLPTDDEWIILETTVGMLNIEAEKSGWRGTHPGQAPRLLFGGSSKLELLLCGIIYCSKNLFKPGHKSCYGDYFNKQAYYWTATKKSRTQIWIRHFKLRASIERTSVDILNKLNVRCIKNN